MNDISGDVVVAPDAPQTVTLIWFDTFPILSRLPNSLDIRKYQERFSILIMYVLRKLC